MSLLDGKRKASAYGNPEFFVLNDFKGKIRFRRDSLMQYDCIHNEKKNRFDIELTFSHKISENSHVYTYTIPEDQEKDKDRIVAKLDKLMNVKLI